MNQIKQIQGVENIVLTQRDGNPIQYSGVWLSKDEIYNVSAATSAIYNCGIEIFSDGLKYLLIEGEKAKILLSPLKNFGNKTVQRIITAQELQGNDNEFYVAITMRPQINLGGIFLKTRNSLSEIKKSLILSGESFKPPLRKFSNMQVKNLINHSDIKDSIENKDDISYLSTQISSNIQFELDNLLNSFLKHILDLNSSYIALEGGFVISKIASNKSYFDDIDRNATMSYSLLSTAEKCSWMLKNMHVKSILLESTNKFQFINKVEKGIFSTQLQKGRQKLGLLRLIIPRYKKKVEQQLRNLENIEPISQIPKFNNLFSEIAL